MRPRWGRILLALGIVAVLGMGTATVMFSSWTAVEQTTGDGAKQAFDEARAQAGGGPAYVEIGDGVRKRQELERDFATDLARLHVVSWKPAEGRLVRMAFPFWFVRMKTTDRVNVGTLISALATDWEDLDLDVTVADLERLGQALVLDHARENGARILLWTEAK